jgi:hypothetical protein
MPDVITRTVEFALERKIAAALARMESTPREPDASLVRLEELVLEVEKRGVKIAPLTLEDSFTSAVETVADHLVPGWSVKTISALLRTLAAAASLGVTPKLWAVQNAVLSALQQRPPGSNATKELRELLEKLGLELELETSD